MLFDAFIPQTRKHNEEALQESRILIAIILICLFTFLTVLTWVNLAPNITFAGQFYGNIICSAAFLGYSICLFTFKYLRSTVITANITIAVSIASILAGIFVSGGPLAAPANIMILLPIIMAFILINKQAGLAWTLIIMICHIIMVLLHIGGFQYPQLLAEDTLAVQHLAHWFMAYTAIIGLMYFSDSINDKLQQALDAKQKHFEHLASHDSLTSLANRLQFDAKLSMAIERSQQFGSPFALLFIDLDGFKPVNDQLGHDAGDAVLKEVAQRLKSVVRDSDTVARIGGDEFAIILEGLHNNDGATRVAQGLCKAIAKPFNAIASSPKIGASVGIALYPTHSKDKEELIKLADTAMYQAKQERGTWQFYQP